MTMTDTDAPKTPEIADPNDIARRLMVVAAHFAGAAMEQYNAAFPEQAEILARSGSVFAVRVDNLLSDRPRVSLVNVLTRLEIAGEFCSREVEIAHVSLSAPGPAAARH